MTTPGPPTTPSSKLGSYSPALLPSLTPRRSRYSPHTPTPKQIAAKVAHNFLPNTGPSELLYGGAAGGGKSDWLLDSALEYTNVPGYAAIIFRRTYTDLALPGAIMNRAKQWMGTSFWNEQQKTFTFPGTEPVSSLTFAYLRHLDDIYRYQSAEFQFVGFDELTQFMESQYVYLFSRLRRPAIPCGECRKPWPCADHPGAAYDPAAEAWRLGLAKVPLRMRAASNPGGIGHGWVKKRFPIRPGETKGQRIFIPARLTDNPHVDQASYAAGLRKLSPALAEQLLEGNWDAFEGQAYPETDESVHAVAPLALSTIAHWARHEGMDHGVTNPTAWLLFLTDYDGNIVVADEYYLAGALPSRHAAEILDRRNEWWEQRENGDPHGRPVRHVAWGDPASLRESLPTSNKIGDPLTLADEYRSYGIALSPANNRRRAGFVHIREMLEPSCACSEEPLRSRERCPVCEKGERRRFPLWHPLAGRLGAPRLFIVRERCPELWEQVVNAPLATEELDPERGEAVDRRWESQYGHGHAALRYGLLGPKHTSREPEPGLPDDPKQRFMVEQRLERERAYRRGPSGRRSQDW